MSNWLPQQDVLAHPNLKVFITHAGQSSFQETLCHQKPVVAIPVSGDQPINALEVERLGFGKSIRFSELKVILKKLLLGQSVGPSPHRVLKTGIYYFSKLINFKIVCTSF